ncbi:hypothetical protein ACS8Y6_17380 [Salinisphaera sp. RV14]|uniref:hypothetical protein n=1 Tax=unclassified Salinisphaera TaxID=2649847 RepID=UPI003F869B80
MNAHDGLMMPGKKGQPTRHVTRVNSEPADATMQADRMTKIRKWAESQAAFCAAHSLSQMSFQH